MHPLSATFPLKGVNLQGFINIFPKKKGGVAGSEPATRAPRYVGIADI
uniref:Uncharacterized protein n=1 Tax=viral metagenome TaxID=1070528 RepID=A0A6C0JHS2_9ZZZZ